MRRWVEIAEQKYPGQFFEAPADVYRKLASDVVHTLVEVSIDAHSDVADLLDASVFAAAINDAKESIAYSLTYKLFCIDAETGGHEQLDALAADLDVAQPAKATHDEQVMRLRQNAAVQVQKPGNVGRTPSDVGITFYDLD